MPPPPAPAPHGGGEAATSKCDEEHQQQQQQQQQQAPQRAGPTPTTATVAARAAAADADAHERTTTSPPLLLTLSVLPRRHVKTLHLVRHAEGFHNVAGAVDYAQYKLERFLDAHLTREGWRQAHALREAIAKGGSGEPCGGGGGNGGDGGGGGGGGGSSSSRRPPRPEVVLVSPMARALETAVAAFGGAVLDAQEEEAVEGGADGATNANGGGASNNARPLLLMRRQSDEPDVREAHPAISSLRAPPFAAVEAARERLGVHPCDRRRPLSSKRRAFPAVDWASHAIAEEDELWDAEHRETEAEIRERAMGLLRFVATGRSEDELAVVSHSSLLWHLLAAAARDEGVRRPFANAELRTVVLVVSP